MKEAKVMADNLNLDSGLNIAGIFALAKEEPDKDFTFRRERDTAIFLADLEKTEPPPVKKRDKYPCRTCDYFEFCHLYIVWGLLKTQVFGQDIYVSTTPNY